MLMVILLTDWFKLVQNILLRVTANVAHRLIEAEKLGKIVCGKLTNVNNQLSHYQV